MAVANRDNNNADDDVEEFQPQLVHSESVAEKRESKDRATLNKTRHRHRPEGFIIRHQS